MHQNKCFLFHAVSGQVCGRHSVEVANAPIRFVWERQWLASRGRYLRSTQWAVPHSRLPRVVNSYSQFQTLRQHWTQHVDAEVLSAFFFSHQMNFVRLEIAHSEAMEIFVALHNQYVALKKTQWICTDLNMPFSLQFCQYLNSFMITSKFYFILIWSTF